MAKSSTGLKAHTKIKKAFDGIIDFPDGCLGYEVVFSIKSYQIDIEFINGDKLTRIGEVANNIIMDVLRSLFVTLPDNISSIGFRVYPEEAFVLGVTYLADFK